MSRERRVRGKKGNNGIIHLDRRKLFDGECELCGAESDLRPYGPLGEWICIDCAKQDVATTEARMDQVLFGEKN